MLCAQVMGRNETCWRDFQKPGAVVKQSTLEVVEIVIMANHRITGDDDRLAVDQGFKLETEGRSEIRLEVLGDNPGGRIINNWSDVVRSDLTWRVSFLPFLPLITLVFLEWLHLFLLLTNQAQKR